MTQKQAKMSVVLACTIPGCGHGDDGTKYKTPALVPDIAFALLNMHRADRHGVHGTGGGGAAAEGEGGVQLTRPSISYGCSQEEFDLFTKAWTTNVIETEVEDDD